MSSRGARRPARVGDIVKERIAALGWEHRLREEDVLAGWDAAVGPQIAAHARASHIVGRRLTVVTENPVWTQQLALLKPELLRRIAGRFGPEVVTDLFFVTGKLDPLPAPQAPAARAKRSAEIPSELTGEIEAIGDGGVRESVRRLILAALAADGSGS